MRGIVFKLVVAAVALGALGGAVALVFHDWDRAGREHRRLVADGVEITGRVVPGEHPLPDGRFWVAYDRLGPQTAVLRCPPEGCPASTLTLWVDDDDPHRFTTADGQVIGTLPMRHDAFAAGLLFLFGLIVFAWYRSTADRAGYAEELEAQREARLALTGDDTPVADPPFADVTPPRRRRSPLRRSKDRRNRRP